MGKGLMAHAEATINRDYGACDVCGCWTCKKCHNACDFVNRSGASEWNGRCELFKAFFAKSRSHVCVDWPRCNHIDGD